MLSVVTMEAIIRWGAGNRSASWSRQTLRDRAEVILSGVTRMGDRQLTADPAVSDSDGT